MRFSYLTYRQFSGVFCRRGLLPLLFATLLLSAACHLPTVYAPAQPMEGRGSFIHLRQAGLNRVMLQRKAEDPDFATLSLQNTGLAPIQKIEIRGPGDAPYLDISASHLLPDDIASFHLLPTERFVCSMSKPTKGRASMLNGFFLWEMPRDPRQLATCLSRRVGMDLDPTGGLSLMPRAEDSLVEIPLNSPLPLDKIKIAWEVTPEDTPVTAWFCVEGRSWARVSTSGRRVSWTEPLDMSRNIKGHRSFTIRLAVEAADPLTVYDGQPINVSRLRIEREFLIQGQLQPMRTGLNELSVFFDAPAEPEPCLDVSLMASQ